MNVYSTEIEAKVMTALSKTGIPELNTIQGLNELPGDYINMDCTLPNGSAGKILDDGKTYLAAQVEIPESNLCYGIAADEKQLAVYQYGCNGTNAVLILWTVLP